MYVYSKERGVKKLREEATLEQYQAKYPSAVECFPPDEDQLGDWVHDSICETPCGCQVEPDGHCEHGNPSWLLVMGLI